MQRPKLRKFLPGRPLIVNGAPVLAPRATNDTWTEDLTPEVNTLDETMRTALARAWLDDALAEHASIAAFTRVSMQLLAVGAPPELVEASHQAALDEVRHARACFTLASMYGARWEAPGPMPVDAIRKAACDRVTIAREALLEGCLGEATATAIARYGAETCTDNVVKLILEGIAQDEESHVQLAWGIVGWCISTGGDVVANAIGDALRAMSFAQFAIEPLTGIDVAVWQQAGRITPEKASSIHSEVVADVAGTARRHPALARCMAVAPSVTSVSPRRQQPQARKKR
jgi:hypothetical protein